MFNLLLVSLVILSSCKEVVYEAAPSPETKYVISNEKDALVGIFLLPDNGSLELLKLESGSYTVYGTQRFLSNNTDSTKTLHPALPVTPLSVVDGEIYGSYSISYSAIHNLTRDSDNVSILGSRLTYYRIKKDSNNKLEISLKIYSVSGLNVECDRTIMEE